MYVSLGLNQALQWLTNKAKQVDNKRDMQYRDFIIKQIVTKFLLSLNYTGDSLKMPSLTILRFKASAFLTPFLF